MGLFHAAFGFFLTWWGAYLLALLDATMVFFLPFGVDALVIYLSARHDGMFFWIYPLLATAGSITGAAFTYWIGRKVGEIGLERLVPGHRFERVRARVQKQGAIAMAFAALLPPPFPLTPFVLTCGALEVDRRIFFGTFALMRLIRFGSEAALARVYGRGVLRVLESVQFQTVIVAFIVVAVIGTLVSAVMLWKSARQPSLRPA
jgi:membrane protein YqaA with SNARE-associated domain